MILSAHALIAVAVTITSPVTTVTDQRAAQVWEHGGGPAEGGPPRVPLRGSQPDGG